MRLCEPPLTGGTPFEINKVMVAKRKVQGSRLFYRHLGYFAVLALAFYLLKVMGIGCPFRRVLGIPCPACGMTRSLGALLRLDFAASFAYHPLTLPLLAVLWLGFHQGLRQTARFLIAVCRFHPFRSY